NYFKRFEDHRIRILGGINVRRNYFESQPYGFYGFDPQSLTHITNIDYQNGYNPKLHGDSDFRGGQIPPIPTLPSTSIRIRGRDDRYVSFYGNTGYSYKDKYDLTGSIRLDQTN